MRNFIFSSVTVSKGFDGKPAVEYFQKEGKTVVARFTVSDSVYDKNAENNRRWVNIPVTVLGERSCERLQKMKLDAGAVINLTGTVDQDKYTDKDGKNRSRITFVANNVEYAAGRRKEGNEASKEAPADSGSSDSAASNAEYTTFADSDDDLPF